MFLDDTQSTAWKSDDTISSARKCYRVPEFATQFRSKMHSVRLPVSGRDNKA